MPGGHGQNFFVLKDVYKHLYDRGVRYAGPLPDEVQMALDYEAAMLTRSDKDSEVRKLLDYFRTDAAREAFARTGVDVTV